MWFFHTIRAVMICKSNWELQPKHLLSHAVVQKEGTATVFNSPTVWTQLWRCFLSSYCNKTKFDFSINIINGTLTAKYCNTFHHVITRVYSSLLSRWRETQIQTCNTHAGLLFGNILTVIQWNRGMTWTVTQKSRCEFTPWILAYLYTLTQCSC